MDLKSFKTLINHRTGLVFDDTRLHILRDGVKHQMKKQACETPDQYHRLLCCNEEVFSQLVDVLTINETFFFREPAYLELMAKRLIPEIHSRGKMGISILSAGCSTGEEPYSIAMSIAEYLGPAFLDNVRIVGGDIDRTALEIAGAGIYRHRKFRKLDKRLILKYFDPLENGYSSIKSFIAEHVKFIYLNLLSNPLPEIVHGVDIIFYRNVSIYFDAETRMNVFAGLNTLLNPGGWLIVGASETLSHEADFLSRQERDGLFIYEKKKFSRTRTVESCDLNSAVPVREMMPGALGTRQSLSRFNDPTEPDAGTNDTQNNDMFRTARKQTGLARIYEDALDLAEKKSFEAALSAVDGLLGHGASVSEELNLKARLLKVGVLLERRLLADADRICRKILEENRSCAGAYLFQGLIARILQQTETALKRFRETIYIQPSNWLAHFFLSEIYHEKGNVELSSRESAIVLKLLEKGAVHGIDFFPFNYSRVRLARYCRKRLMEK